MPAVLRRICDEEPTPIGEYRADVPAAVSAVLAIAMAKKPAQRYAHASDLARDLRAALAGTLEPAVTERARMLSRGKPSQRRIERPATVDETGETHLG